MLILGHPRPMKTAALLCLAALITLTARAADPSPATWRYTAELEYIAPTADGFRPLFNLRKDGDVFTIWQPEVKPGHPEFARFQHAATRLATERLYYELIFREEMPAASGPPHVHLGIVTPENLRDLVEFDRIRGTRTRQLPITDLLTIRPITQNEYLAITPRIVTP